MAPALRNRTHNACGAIADRAIADSEDDQRRQSVSSHATEAKSASSNESESDNLPGVPVSENGEVLYEGRFRRITRISEYCLYKQHEAPAFLLDNKYILSGFRGYFRFGGIQHYKLVI